jgi:hypothetical protein
MESNVDIRIGIKRRMEILDNNGARKEFVFNNNNNNKKKKKKCYVTQLLLSTFTLLQELRLFFFPLGGAIHDFTYTIYFRVRSST